MLPEPLLRFAATHHGVVTRDAACRAGLNRHDIDTKVRRGEWRRLYRGTYLVDADMYSEVPFSSLATAALLSSGPHAFLVIDTALRWYEVEGLPTEPTAIHVGLPSVIRRRQRRTGPDSLPPLVQHWLAPERTTVVMVDGLRVLGPVTALAHSLPEFDRPTSLSVLDSALHRRLITPTQLEDIATWAAARPGAGHVLEMVRLADGRAASPLESRCRLICVDGGMPPDELQIPLIDGNGVLLGRGDIGWRRRRGIVLAECDGLGPHSLPGALLYDRRRQNDVPYAGVIHVLRWSWADALHRSYVLSSARRALADAD